MTILSELLEAGQHLDDAGARKLATKLSEEGEKILADKDKSKLKKRHELIMNLSAFQAGMACDELNEKSRRSKFFPKLATIDMRESMNKARLQSKLNNITSTENKVYNVVSYSTPMTVNDITSDLSDKGVVLQKPNLIRAINCLIDAGLIKKAGHFKFLKTDEEPMNETKTKPKKAANINSKPTLNPAPVSSTKLECDPILELMILGEALMKMAEQVEVISRTVIASLNTNDEKQQKLENLATALKELSV